MGFSSRQSIYDLPNYSRGSESTSSNACRGKIVFFFLFVTLIGPKKTATLQILCNIEKE